MLHAPVLQLDAARMHEIDPRNVENLFGMWTVFSKCASTIPDGKRLENLSWRVWGRETLCCPPQPEKTIVPAIDIPLLPKEDVPSLSSSLGSYSDGESVNSDLENSALSKSRGKEPHLTPHRLEKIITDIQEQKTLEPLDPEIEEAVVAKIMSEKHSDKQEQSLESHTTEVSCISTATNTTANTLDTERESTHRDSDTSASSDGLIKSGSVVHGFSPLPSLRSRGSATISKNMPIFATKNAAKTSTAKKGGMFTLGGSSEDDESSFEQQMSYRKHLLEPKKSSLSRSLTRDQQPQQKKTTSFREVVEQHTIQSGSPADDNAIASDDEDDEDDDESVIDDSAIEEDDDEGWEDEQPEEEKPPTQPVFKRVDSTANLPSRRSVLTAGLTEGERAKGLLSAASKSSPAIRRMDRSSSHNGPSMQGSPEQRNEDVLMMAPSNISRAIDMPPPTNADVYTLAHSPRTTRRNMLSTELTESLRKNLLWERQQKNTTVNAFLKREAKSMANLQRAGQMAVAQPQPHRALLQREPTKTSSYNEYFDVANEYHTKGW